MVQRYKNPSNGYVEEVGFGTSIAMFCFGPLYLAVKGLWGHVFIWLAAVVLPGVASGGPLLILTLPLGSLIYAWLIQGILDKKYLSKGWVRADRESTTEPVEYLQSQTKSLTKKCPFCAEEIKSEAIRCKHCQADLSATAT